MTRRKGEEQNMTREGRDRTRDQKKGRMGDENKDKREERKIKEWRKNYKKGKKGREIRLGGKRKMK